MYHSFFCDEQGNQINLLKGNQISRASTIYLGDYAGFFGNSTRVSGASVASRSGGIIINKNTFLAGSRHLDDGFWLAIVESDKLVSSLILDVSVTFTRVTVWHGGIGYTNEELSMSGGAVDLDSGRVFEDTYPHLRENGISYWFYSQSLRPIPLVITFPTTPVARFIFRKPVPTSRRFQVFFRFNTFTGGGGAIQSDSSVSAVLNFADITF